jgi:hypothetical protein
MSAAQRGASEHFVARERRRDFNRRAARHAGNQSAGATAALMPDPVRSR